LLSERALEDWLRKLVSKHLTFSNFFKKSYHHFLFSKKKKKIKSIAKKPISTMEIKIPENYDIKNINLEIFDEKLIISLIRQAFEEKTKGDFEKVNQMSQEIFFKLEIFDGSKISFFLKKREKKIVS